MKLTRQQLQNDLDAAKRREKMSQDTELRLVDKINTARNDYTALTNELVKAYRERDDWRDAFKLIMKLVK